LDKTALVKFQLATFFRVVGGVKERILKALKIIRLPKSEFSTRQLTKISLPSPCCKSCLVVPAAANFNVAWSFVLKLVSEREEPPEKKRASNKSNRIWAGLNNEFP
jgi:hypothetical protein